MPNINFNKKTILTFLAIIWISFSVIYIAFDIWNDFKVRQLAHTFELGRVNAITEIIRQGMDERCEPVVLFKEGVEVRLINIDCLEEQM